MSNLDRKKKKQLRNVTIRDFLKFYLGCQSCGRLFAPPNLKELEFHHLIPSSSDKQVAKLFCTAATLQQLRTETRKCNLVCKKCHDAVSIKLRNLTRTYMRNHSGRSIAFVRGASDDVLNIYRAGLPMVIQKKICVFAWNAVATRMKII